MKRKLEVVLVAPSHYDDDGYVHRYWRGVVPSNTLCCLKSLVESVETRHELGEDVEISVRIYDDNVQRVPIRRIIRKHQRGRERVLVGLVGVQSNQFARASDLALALRAGGVPVMIGGFHVSGVLALFPKPTRELQLLLDAGVTLVKGEVEGPGVMAGILKDALEDKLQPIYNITVSPELQAAPVPKPDKKYLKHFLLPHLSTLDTSRGCPFNCSFCTIINVQGRKMRCRSATQILQTIRENYANGITSYFFTDDNLSRSQAWEPLFDGLRMMRQQGMNVTFMMQVDTQAYRIPNFVSKARDAGCDTVFVGMETVNPKNIEATGKVQNDAEFYPEMVQTWHDAGIRVHVGYIIGLPHDTKESIRLDVQTLRDIVKVDEASFFMLTPLPGSKDHQTLVEQGVPIDADLNNFDSIHETFRHQSFQPGEWRTAFEEAWEAFYNPESILHILMRAPREQYWGLFWTCLWYRWSSCFVKTHPMGTGLFRLKERTTRRPIFPKENIWQYAIRRIKDVWWGAKVYAQLFWEFQEIWMLSRKPEDPRWATLAYLRDRWARVRHHIAVLNVRDRCDVAAQEVRNMLVTAATKLEELSRTPRCMGKRTQRRLEHKAHEVREYLKSFEIHSPTWDDVYKAQQYIRDSVMAGYEEAVIKYVAQRRRLNAWRQELKEQVKSGGIWALDVGKAVRLAITETLFAVRFWYSSLTQGV